MRYRVPGGVLRAELEGKEVLLDPARGTYHLVNETGRRLLAGFESGKSVTEVVQDLTGASGELPSRVASDVDAFVRAMMERGLIEEVPG